MYAARAHLPTAPRVGAPSGRPQGYVMRIVAKQSAAAARSPLTTWWRGHESPAAAPVAPYCTMRLSTSEKGWSSVSPPTERNMANTSVRFP